MEIGCGDGVDEYQVKLVVLLFEDGGEVFNFSEPVFQLSEVFSELFYYEFKLLLVDLVHVLGSRD